MNRLPVRNFVADSTLGRLAKWLRLMGFDTALDDRTPAPHRLIRLGADNRLILTRSSRVYHQLVDSSVLLIESEQPQVQILQIICELHIRREEVRPFTRCAACNAALRILPKADAAGLVPEYILGHQQRFHQCPRCRRIYWSGSHRRRWSDMMDQWFNDGEV
jgi:uncharacterized protein with PIN domain